MLLNQKKFITPVPGLLVWILNWFIIKFGLAPSHFSNATNKQMIHRFSLNNFISSHNNYCEFLTPKAAAKQQLLFNSPASDLIHLGLLFNCSTNCQTAPGQMFSNKLETLRSGAVFTTLYFLCNLQMSPIS
jgi:hypothetical protein